MKLNLKVEFRDKNNRFESSKDEIEPRVIVQRPK